MISTNRFTYDKQQHTFIAEISSLRDEFGQSVPRVIELRSAKTGKVAVFENITTDKDGEGDVLAWQYRPTWTTTRAYPGLAGTSLVLIND